MQSTKQAIFNLGEAEYSLDIMDVVTIEKVIAVESVSSLPENFKGVINLRGEVIPVYSLRRKFGMEDIQPDLDTRFVITMTNDVKVAYEVDKMTGIVQVSGEQLNEVPAIVQDKNTSYLKSITKVNDRLVIILNKDGILAEEEQKKLKTAIKKL